MGDTLHLLYLLCTQFLYGPLGAPYGLIVYGPIHAALSTKLHFLELILYFSSTICS